MNALIEEVTGVMPPSARRAAALEPDHCSDYVVHTTNVCVVGHNEDNAKTSLGNTFLADVSIDGLRWVGYVYAGDLPTGAFGWNSHGMAFTLNYVQPANFVAGGLGRSFISRDLLNAVSLEDAVRRVTVPNQAGG